MTDEPINPVDGVQLLRSYLLHRRCVQSALLKVERALSERADYKSGLAQERPIIDLHYSRNSHHPEFHGSDIEGRVCVGVEVAAQNMTWLDIIEMVCNWRGAFLAYGSQGTWAENIKRQKERYAVDQWFTKEQWWLIEQVAAFIATDARADSGQGN